MARLEEIGIDPSCIPEECGGTWRFRDFCDSIETQIQLDTNKRIAVDASQTLPNQMNGKISLATMAQHSPPLAAAQPNTKESPQLPGGGIARAPEMYTTSLVLQTCAELDKNNKKANRDKDFYLKRNAVYSRRNYLRRKERDQALHQEHEQLLEQKEALQFENERLEGLLIKAKAMVADLL